MKSEGRTANSMRNISFGFSQIVIKQVLPFLVRTILIYRFGVDYLGLNSVLASVLNVLSLMELGFGSAIVYSMYKPVAEGDTKQICAFLSYYQRVYRYVGLAILGIGLLLIPFLPAIIHDTTIPGNLNVHVYYFIFLSNTVISYELYGYLTAVPTAYQRRDLLSKIDILIVIFRSSAQSIILLFTSDFYLYLLTMPFFTIVQNLAIAYIVKKRYPELKCKGNITQQQKNDIKKRVSGLLINRLTGVSRNGIDTICISAFIGLVTTGIYSNYLFVMSSVLSITLVISQSITPSIGNSIAMESRDKNYSDMCLFDFIYMMIAGVATTCMFCLYQPFIRLWAGKENMLSLTVVIGMSMYFYILESGVIAWAYTEGTGLWFECRYYYISEAISNLILNVILCKALGVVGIVLATVVSVFISNALFPKVVFKQYFRNGKIKGYWADHIKYTITMLITGVLSWFICEGLLPIGDRGMLLNIICLVGRLIICLFVSILVFWGIWHKSERYHNALAWIKRLRSDKDDIKSTY